MKHSLFITPILPHPTGSGCAMRASVTLEALAQLQPVIVVHARLWGDRQGIFNPEWARARAAALFQVNPDRLRDIRALVEDFLEGVPGGGTLDVIYAFRQVVAPSAIACIGAGGLSPRVTVLDLDDDECGRTEPFAQLHEVSGRQELAQRLRRDLPQLTLGRQMIMERFQHVLLANPDDQRNLQESYPDSAIAQLPNVIREPARPAVRQTRDPHRILFVGTLDYFPNEDAVTYFVRDILPLIRVAEPSAYLRIVGVGGGDAMAALANEAGVQLVGAVPELGPEYEVASMAVVPLRAGSGTRIKILEAFAYGVPVVSTPLGAAGLAVKDGEELLLADSPTEFAAACLQLGRDATIRERLAGSAGAWVREHHSTAAVARLLEALLRPDGR
jgi:glycosyltransferase involved in cell wall biosynthesis